MRIYMYNDGLARLATVPYQQPSKKNATNLCMHLTNYAINKESSDYVFNINADRDDIGSKRSYKAVLKILRENHGPEAVKKMELEIHDIIVKTMCIAQPHVYHLQNQSCF
jgi:tubulin polyglutamylase TTLL6/13